MFINLKIGGILHQAVFLFYTVAPLIVHGQLQNRNWHFGNHASLIIDTMSIQEYAYSQIDANGACASISSVTGYSLLYADDSNVYNGNDQIVTNGTGLIGDPGSTQGSLFLPKPGNASIYYLFQEGGIWDPSIYFTTIDVTGNGTVLQKNVWVDYPVTEKMTSVLHANGEDYWVILHERASDKFLSYHLSSNGLDTVPVESSSGTELLWSAQQSAGYMRADLAGNRIAYAIYGKDLLELCEFDVQSGMVSNCSTIDTLPRPFGVEFSHDGSKLYCSVSGHTVGDSIFIYQYDLLAGNLADIAASRYKVAGNVLQTGGVNSFGDIAIALDKRIYVNRPYTNKLSHISVPDSSGVACNYVDIGFEMIVGQCISSLPNQIKKYADVTNTIMEYEGIPELSVYPNPAHDQLYVQHTFTSSAMTFDLYDQSGRVVLSGELRREDRYSIDRGALESGLYHGVIRDKERITGSLRVIFQ